MSVAVSVAGSAVQPPHDSSNDNKEHPPPWYQAQGSLTTTTTTERSPHPDGHRSPTKRHRGQRSAHRKSKSPKSHYKTKSLIHRSRLEHQQAMEKDRQRWWTVQQQQQQQRLRHPSAFPVAFPRRHEEEVEVEEYDTDDNDDDYIFRFRRSDDQDDVPLAMVFRRLR